MYLSFLDPSKFIDTISIIVLGILGVVWGIIRFFKSKNQTENFIEVHTQIHELLTELRVVSKAMRASIIQFHNGEYSMDGISMLKFSVTHESTYKGYTSQVSKLKGSMCSVYIPLLTKAIENKPTIHYTKFLPESYVKSFFDDENVSQYACLLLKNKGVNVGILLIQWHHDFEIQNGDQEIAMKSFEGIRDSIEVQLSQQKK